MKADEFFKGLDKEGRVNGKKRDVWGPWRWGHMAAEGFAELGACLRLAEGTC